MDCAQAPINEVSGFADAMSHDLRIIGQHCHRMVLVEATENPARVNWIVAMLESEGIAAMVAETPRLSPLMTAGPARIYVASEHLARARALIAELGKNEPADPEAVVDDGENGRPWLLPDAEAKRFSWLGCLLVLLGLVWLVISLVGQLFRR